MTWPLTHRPTITTSQPRRRFEHDEPKKRASKAEPKTYQDLIAEGWTGLAIKAGTHRSRDILYDPATHRMELADERYGEGGADLDGSDEVPEVRVEEFGNGGFAVIDATAERDFTVAFRLVPEIRK